MTICSLLQKGDHPVQNQKKDNLRHNTINNNKGDENHNKKGLEQNSDLD